MNSDYLKFLRKNRTMVIASDGVKLWASKVYYALDKGFIFLIEKGSLMLENIRRNNQVAFEIDDNKLRIFIQDRVGLKFWENRQNSIEKGVFLYTST
jgi:hypothetical protein